MEKREADALLRYRNLTGTVENPNNKGFTDASDAAIDSSTDGKIVHEDSSREKNCEENSKVIGDLGGCSISLSSLAENIGCIEDNSVNSKKHSGDVNMDSEIDKLNTGKNISNPAPNTDDLELIDSGRFSAKVDVQLIDDNKMKHANDGFDLTENQVIGHSVKDDCTDAAIIACNSKEISDANGAEPDTDGLLNNESRNGTTKKYDYSSQGTNEYIGKTVIDETGAASGKHDDSDEFLNISSGAYQKSCNNSSFEDLENQERTNTAEDGSASDKSSSYVNISNNTDVDSVYSAISYDNDNMSVDVSPVKSSANNSTEDTEILELSNETVDKMSAENLDAESDMREDGNPLTLEERLEMIHGANLSFTSNIAALAAAKSRAFGLVEESTYGGETFGDMSDSDEDSSVQ